jgi:hypothetical protein
MIGVAPLETGRNGERLFPSSTALCLAMPLSLVERHHGGHPPTVLNLGLLEHGQRHHEVGHASAEEATQHLGVLAELFGNRVVQPRAQLKLSNRRHNPGVAGQADDARRETRPSATRCRPEARRALAAGSRSKREPRRRSPWVCPGSTREPKPPTLPRGLNAKRSRLVRLSVRLERGGADGPLLEPGVLALPAHARHG